MTRPFSEDLLEYAAIDIYKLAALYPKLIKGPQTDLIAISARYSRLYSQRRVRSDKFCNNGFLPKEVLDSPLGPKRACQGCKRALTEASYTSSRRPMCIVCVRVARR